GPAPAHRRGMGEPSGQGCQHRVREQPGRDHAGTAGRGHGPAAGHGRARRRRPARQPVLHRTGPRGSGVKITAIRLHRMRLPLVPPFRAAWDPVPREAFDATLVRVETDEGVTGYAAFEDLFLGRDPARIARHVRTLETVGFHASRYWPLEVALWDIAGQVAGQPVAALFGGARRRVPAYASFGEIKSPQQRADA